MQQTLKQRKYIRLSYYSTLPRVWYQITSKGNPEAGTDAKNWKPSDDVDGMQCYMQISMNVTADIPIFKHRGQSLAEFPLTTSSSLSLYSLLNSPTKVTNFLGKMTNVTESQFVSKHK